MDFSTRCVHGSDKKYDTTGALSVPIFQSATFAHPGVGQSTGYDYARSQNPTREHLEITMANLENGSHAFAFATGMAALTTMLALFAPGDHFVCSSDLYGGTHRLFFRVAQRFGLSFSLVDTTEIAAVEAAILPATRVIFIETPSNPMMHVTDIAGVATLCREQGLRLVVDNTFLTPYLQKPLDLGADIVLHSGTKYLGGHNDTLAGFLVVKNEELAEELSFLSKTFGPCLGAFDSWLLIRSLKTLAIRLDRQQDTARRLAEELSTWPEVTAVHYPGLPSHPQYALSQTQARGPGAMISFSLGDADLAKRALERLRVISYAESLGGVESLITFPVLQTHADIPEEERLAQGITDKLLRLSVGLEAPEDLIADLRQAVRAHD